MKAMFSHVQVERKGEGGGGVGFAKNSVTIINELIHDQIIESYSFLFHYVRKQYSNGLLQKGFNEKTHHLWMKSYGCTKSNPP